MYLNVSDNPEPPGPRCTEVSVITESGRANKPSSGQQDKPLLWLLPVQRKKRKKKKKKVL